MSLLSTELCTKVKEELEDSTFLISHGEVVVK